MRTRQIELKNWVMNVILGQSKKAHLRRHEFSSFLVVFFQENELFEASRTCRLRPRTYYYERLRILPPIQYISYISIRKNKFRPFVLQDGS